MKIAYTKRYVEGSQREIEQRNIEKILCKHGIAIVKLEISQNVKDFALDILDFVVLTKNVNIGVYRFSYPSSNSVHDVINSRKRSVIVDSPNFPINLDCNDVLVIGKSIFVRISPRTTFQSINALIELVGSCGYIVKTLPLFHTNIPLSMMVGKLNENTILVNTALIKKDFFEFENVEILEVHESETSFPSASVLAIGDNVVLYPTSYPMTAKTLVDNGFVVEYVEMTDLIRCGCYISKTAFLIN